MKHIKLFENFEEDKEANLSLELEYKLRTLSDDSEFTIDDFLMEFGVDLKSMTNFGWAAILKGADEYKDMGEEEFFNLYNEYKGL